MDKKHIVVIGAGLAGVTLANLLSEFAKITLIEKGSQQPEMPNSKFLKREFGSSTTYCHGHGGTTNLWHNGLIDLPSAHVSEHFKEILKSADKYKNSAASSLNFLGDYTEEKSSSLSEVVGVLNNSDMVLDSILVPNEIPALQANADVNLILNVDNIEFYVENDTVTSCLISYNEKEETVLADEFIVCAGGIGSPKIIKKINDAANKNTASLGGNFIDHPMGFIGKINVKSRFKGLFSLLSHRERKDYSYRTGIVIKNRDKHHIFYFRPAITMSNSLGLYKFKSKLGSSTWKQRLKLIFDFRILHPEIIQEIFAHLFSFRLITNKFSVWAVFEQNSDDHYIDVNHFKHEDVISWDISEQDIEEFRESIKIFLHKIEPYIKESCFEFDNLIDYLWSAAHHSGSCAIGKEGAVVDENLKVRGLNNVYVCDGSVIPQASYANTGLVIGQLCFRLKDYLLKG